ncbi:prepilin peptidase [Microbacterium sp.]|uniref:prepilin peptidase n=1 Tax=Microbacterium sp. TaxID=51671 RepID=UPI0039E2E38B
MIGMSGLVTVVAFGVFAVVGVLLVIIDVREHRLPNRLVLPLYGVGLAPPLVALFAGESDAAIRALVAAASLFAFYFVLHRAGGGMGAGDVKLAGAIGLFLGFLGWTQALLGAIAGFVLGGLWALALLVTRRAHRGTRIAFGPFMLAGAWAAIAATILGG